MSITFGEVLAVSVFEAPLCISLWYLINVLRRIGANDSRSIRGVFHIVLLSALSSVMIALVVCVMVVVVSPSALASIPIAIKLALVIILLTFYGCFVGLAIGLALGLKDVVRAGGSSTKTMGTLLRCIQDGLNLNKDKRNTETTDPERKDRP